MNKTTVIIAGGIAALALGGVGLAQTQSPLAVLDTSKAQQITWVKPTTDAQWAQESKQENFDIKSDDKLIELRDSQIAKLAKEQEDNKKYQDCPQCVQYDLYQQFLQSGMDDATAQTESTNQANTEIKQHEWEIEKIAQSIERINHELDLRARGVVITATDSTGKARKASDLTGKIVRTIND